MKLNSFFLILLWVSAAFTQNTIQLTLDKAVDIAFNNSYRIRQVELDIERTRLWLRARQAGLRSRVYMNLETPDLQRISDYKWNSNLQRDQLVRQNTQMWQSDLSIRQPVIFFGYPTNGYVSLNYKVYRYLQKDNGDQDVTYYNRFYFKFEQPFFTPNRLKFNLEEAELNLTDSQLEYLDDKMDIMQDIGDDYYDLFRLSYRSEIYQEQLKILQTILAVSDSLVALDSSLVSDRFQAELELANIREEYLDNQSWYRRELATLKQRLRLSAEDSVTLDPEIDIRPIHVDLEQAMHYGRTLNPSLQRWRIRRRKSEIDVLDEKGDGGFRMKMEVTYGLEKNDDHYANLWQRFDNSNSVTLHAYVPIWDWGERKARIQAEQVDVRRADLAIEEVREDIEKDISTAFLTLQDYFKRALSLRASLETAAEMTQASIDKFRQAQLSVLDLLQIIQRSRQAELNLLDTYLGYRRALLELMQDTYYDFEKQQSFVE
jgi:outer membrane protein TolC